MNAETQATMTEAERHAALRRKYEQLLAEGNAHPNDIGEYITKLRRLILLEGLPPETEEEEQTCVSPDGSIVRCTLRGRIWKILLRVYRVDAQQYISLVENQKCKVYNKIRNDTFRTFPNDKKFCRRVPEEKLIRLLNAFVNHSEQQNTERKFTYLQGMNVLCAPFLYVMPEVDAFFTSCRFITHHCPNYWYDLLGATAGCALMDDCLEVVDPELFSYLKSKNLLANIYAFAPVISLSGSTPPLDELLKLWDFLLAFGVHLNIMCIIAQVVIMRDKLLETSNLKKILDYRKWPHLDSQLMISVMMQLLRQLPDDLYDRLARHPFDREVAKQVLDGRPNYAIPKIIEQFK